MCINHKDDMTEEEDYRDVLTKRIQDTYNKLQQAVLAFNSPFNEAINKEQLDTFPLMKWITLNEKVKIRKRRNRFSSYLCFDTHMKEGGKFGEHFHEDIIESAEVVSGEMLDTSNNVVYTAGDVAHYERGEKHTPIATKDTLLHVLFKP